MEAAKRGWSQPEIGTVVGNRYRIRSVLGQGGMGVVYAVEDMKLGGMLRALKITYPKRGKEGVYSEEAAVLMKLSHPCLPHITDYFPPDEEGNEALVMDYIDGETLYSVVANSSAPLSFPEIMRIGLQLCSALGYLHTLSSPIIHRDLKPSNVMLDREGHVKLIDFGISRHYKEDQAQDTVRLGTAGFAAPEQQGGAQSNARTDVYGLGALLYYMATGGSLYSAGGESAAGRIRLPKSMPPPFAAVLEKMLEPIPGRRYPSMREVERALAPLDAPPLARIAEIGGEQRFRLRSQTPLVGFLSLTPGAGATMLAVTAAMLLGKRGVKVTAAEYYGLPPEWIELLPSGLLLRESGRQEEAVSFSDRFVRRRSADKRIDWLVVNAHHMTDKERDDRMFDLELRHSGSQVQIVDFSGGWDDPRAAYWLRRTSVLFAVGDPFIYKWQVPQLQKLLDLQAELRESGANLHWIANKDCRFRGRSEWLALYPQRPVAIVPHLGQELMLNTVWSGRWLTDMPRIETKLIKTLKPVIGLIEQSMRRN